MLRNQRALKAQKYKAWGNAPDIVPVHAMRAVGAKVAVGVTTASIFDNGTPDHFHDNCHWYRYPGLTLRYFYRKQAAPRPSEQAHGARLALFLRLQRDNSLVIVYLGRCPRLYTVALSARVGYSYVAPIIMVEPVWAVPKFLVVGNTHGVACGKLVVASAIVALDLYASRSRH